MVTNSMTFATLVTLGGVSAIAATCHARSSRIQTLHCGYRFAIAA